MNKYCSGGDYGEAICYGVGIMFLGVEVLLLFGEVFATFWYISFVKRFKNSFSQKLVNREEEYFFIEGAGAPPFYLQKNGS